MFSRRESEAEAARADNTTVFAIGVGKEVFRITCACTTVVLGCLSDEALLLEMYTIAAASSRLRFLGPDEAGTIYISAN